MMRRSQSLPIGQNQQFDDDLSQVKRSSTDEKKSVAPSRKGNGNPLSTASRGNQPPLGSLHHLQRLTSLDGELFQSLGQTIKQKFNRSPVMRNEELQSIAIDGDSDAGDDSKNQPTISSSANQQHEATTPLPLVRTQTDAKLALSEKALLTELCTHQDHGLTDIEWKRRLAEYGPNSLEKASGDTLLMIFLKQFNDPLIYMLIAATIISAIFDELILAIAIIIMLLANAILGTWQNYKAEKSIEALNKNCDVPCVVLRAGMKQQGLVPDLVPGDIVFIKIGDFVPADGILLQSNDLQIDQKMLTGEQQPVKKHLQTSDLKIEGQDYYRELESRRYLHRGTVVTDGSGSFVVTKTGMNTSQGKIASMLNDAAGGESPLKENLERLGKRLGIYSLVASLIIFIVGGLLHGNWLEMLLVSVSVVVAAVPEALPVIITLGLTSGMKKMAEKNVKISNLSAVETLGCTSVICTDKTGTLTTGCMTARDLYVVHPSSTDNCCIQFEITGDAWDYTTGEFILKPLSHGINSNNSNNNNANDINHSVTVPDAFSDSVLVERKSELDYESKTSPYDEQLYFSLLVMRYCNKSSTYYDPVTESWCGEGSMTERALYAASKKSDLFKDNAGPSAKSSSIDANIKLLRVNDFTAARKCMSVVIDLNQQYRTDGMYVLVKGAPSVLLPRCKNRSRDLEQVNDRLASEGRRVLLLAFRRLDISFNSSVDYGCDEKYNSDSLERDLICVGLVGIIDPPREQVPGALLKCRGAGVDVIMITGDFGLTAFAIAQQIGLVSSGNVSVDDVVVDCSKFRNQPEHEQIEMLQKFRVFSRAIPEDKQKMVKLLQSMGHVVGMTGDGVNDAPALKSANIGVAMGITGTDVAKEASDMILTDDNFVGIVSSIAEGRRIWRNLSCAVYHLLSTNVAEVFLVLVAVLSGLESPLLPSQILWLNLTTDASPASALVFEPEDDEDMKRPPRHVEEGFLTKYVMWGMVVNNLALLVVTLLTFVYGLSFNLQVARTMTMYVIVFSELWRGHTCRNMRKNLWQVGIWGNPQEWTATVMSIGLTILVGNVPGLQSLFDMVYLAGAQWTYIFFISFIPPLVDEAWKFAARHWNFAPPKYHQKS